MFANILTVNTGNIFCWVWFLLFCR